MARSPSGDRCDPAEVARAVFVPMAELVDADIHRVAHPSGWLGPGFSASGLFIWGFTAGLLDRMYALGGWERPWDTSGTSRFSQRLIGRPDRP